MQSPLSPFATSDELKTEAEPSEEAERRAEERKRRRMISNRESARRSRMRKQRHLENLRSQLNKCRAENRELNSRLQLVVHHCTRLRTENECLCAQRTLLRQKVSDLTQFLIFQQLQPLQQPSSSSSSMDFMMQYLPLPHPLLINQLN
ncbi:hypothetical protein Fmac_027249 [Flemingia macrophylla]|uniref:BZIP domain-containing protein n=1 Tax=Flemingia macrophylla TaxID=520843 RepID=A0ABD1LH55_9FABA